MDRDQYRMIQQKFNSVYEEKRFIVKMDPSQRPHGRGRFRNRGRIAEHERLQALAKRRREQCWTHSPFFTAIPLRDFIAPPIPLAGCLTPRALMAKRK